MPWWSWLLIWGGLVLGLLGMLAYFAVRLFRKMMTAADALTELGDRVSVLGDALDAESGASDVQSFSPAVFADSAELSFQRSIDKAARAFRRQQRLDLLVERSKLFGNTPSK